MTDILTDEVFPLADGKVAVTVPAMSARVLKTNPLF